jgi:L-lactate dehydrogenase complex protein LldG
MSSDREQILASIRKHSVPPHARPSEGEAWIQYASVREQFAQTLESVGGHAQVLADATAVARTVAGLLVYQQALQRCCELALPTPVEPSLTLHWNVRLDDVSNPHELASLDLAVLPGEFGVAENGAVWVTDRRVRHRVVYFIAQHLVLVVPAERIVSNMHEAYERLEFADNAYGCFISGPSKTADIEQSLVIGAHGPRSLTVLLVHDAASCGLR